MITRIPGRFTARIAACAVLVAGVFFVADRFAPLDRGGAVESGRSRRPIRVVQLDGPETFSRKRGDDHAPVVVIGIDGAAWEFIDPLVERGELPNLARIRREGARSRLRSIPCYVSPPAWTTLFSGYLPERTGVYTFGKWDRARREFVAVNAEDVRVPRVWDVVSRCGARAGVFNVPMTWPPRPLNGEMVSGMMTPVDVGEAAETQPVSTRPLCRVPGGTEPESFSSVLRTACSDSLNSYLWSLYDTFDDGVRDYDTVMLTVFSDDPDGGDAVRSYLFPVGEFSPWIEIRAVRDGGIETAWCRKAIVETPGGRYEARISPCYFDVVEPLAWPDSLAGKLRARFGYYAPSVFVGEDMVGAFTEDAARQAAYFYERDDWDFFAYVFTQSDNVHHLTGFSRRALEVYRKIDHFIGDVMDRMDGDGILLVVSDHGFARYSYGIDLNRYLEKLGLLRRDASGGIDHDNTLVFHDVWHLYFNHAKITREALAARGVDVAPGEDAAERLARYLQDVARRIESADGRHRVSLELTPLAGGRAGTSPDMIVGGTCGRYVVEFLGRVHAHTSVFYELRGEQRWWHRRDGVFMAWGEGIREGYDAGTTNIQDAAPTILYALGLPVAEDMDGRVLDEIFERSFRGDRPVYVVDAYPPDMLPDAGAAVRESLAKKLRTLGYLSP